MFGLSSHAVQGVWDARLQTLADQGLTEDWQYMINSITLCVHLQGFGAKGGGISGVFRSQPYCHREA